jgi:hypothetical protein
MVLKNALIETASKRKSTFVMSDYKTVLVKIAASEQLKGFGKSIRRILTMRRTYDFLEICHID